MDKGRIQNDTGRAADLPDLVPAEARAKAGARQNECRAGKNGNVPPKEYQFKKGQTGNLAGAPKRVFSSLIHAYLSMDDQKMAHKFIRQLYEQACKGNRTAIRVITSRLDRLDCLPEDALLEPSDVESHAKAFQTERKAVRRLRIPGRGSADRGGWVQGTCDIGLTRAQPSWSSGGPAASDRASRPSIQIVAAGG